jgi:hypothetical protein
MEIEELLVQCRIDRSKEEDNIFLSLRVILRFPVLVLFRSQPMFSKVEKASRLWMYNVVHRAEVDVTGSNI